MSTITINSTLILNGNILCNGDVFINSTAVVYSVPDEDLKKTVYSYRTDTYTASNGVGRSITSTEGGVYVDGLIDGEGQGFDANSGPGNNSLGNPFSRFQHEKDCQGCQYGKHQCLGDCS